jgi:hypothetical protein
MVERFNGRIAELLQQPRFHSAADLEKTLLNYLKMYSHGGLKYQLQHWINESNRLAIVAEPYARYKQRAEFSIQVFLEAEY